MYIGSMMIYSKFDQNQMKNVGGVVFLVKRTTNDDDDLRRQTTEKKEESKKYRIYLKTILINE